MADKTKAMGGDWNPGWCLSPKKGLERVMVKLSGTNRSYPYRAYRICHIGDLATVGYWYDKMHPSATSGSTGVIQDMGKQINIAAKNSVELDLVFTRCITRREVTRLVEQMRKEMGFATMETVSEGWSAPGMYSGYACASFIIKFMTMRVISAISVAANGDSSMKDDVTDALQRLRRGPLLEADWDYLNQSIGDYTPYGLEMTGLYVRDEPELMRMRAEMLQERVIGCDFTDVMLENSGYDYDSKDEWSADSFATAKDVFFYCQDKYISPEGRALLGRYLNQCAIMNAISALMHCGMAGLLKTYLLARPPIEGFLSAMIAFAQRKGANWTVELLEAYRRGDMDFISSYPETEKAPLAFALQMPDRPEDLLEQYSPTILRAEARLKRMMDLDMRWLAREEMTDAERIGNCLRTAMKDAEFEGKSVEKTLEPLNTLAELLSDREISEIQGKRFVLLGFANATKKMLGTQLASLGGELQNAPDETTDYVAIYIPQVVKAAPKIKKALTLKKNGSSIELVNERTLWRALNKT